MTFSFEKAETRERARAMHEFMQRCTARGIKVTIRLQNLWDAEHGKEVPALFLAARSVVESRDPVNLQERITGDIRDTITVVALRIGLQTKTA